MIKSHLKTAIRILFKNRLFTIVNVIGLSTGLASIMCLAVLVYQYITTDKNQVDIGQMYYLKTKTPNGNSYSNTTFPLLGEIVKNCPEVASATHIQTWYYPWLKYNEKEFQENTMFVDTGFLDVFRYPFKFGSPVNALKEKYSIILSEEMAVKFFGKINPVGKIISADDSVQLTVTGVLQHVPANSTIRPTILLSTAFLNDNMYFKNGADWYNTFASNYIRLKQHTDPAKLDAKIAGIVHLHYIEDQKKNTIFTVPFVQIRSENGSLTGVIIKGAIGSAIFILLIILMNLVNLNTASMFSRAKEVAVRQMIGGNKKSIVIQFCIENGLVVFVSFLFAWILFSLLLLPSVGNIVKDKFGEIETGFSRDYPLVLLFTGIGLLFTILAASIPALKLVTIKVTAAVKGRLIAGSFRGANLRSVFITAQFVLAITLICITIILNRQVSYMKTAALGFDKENVAVASLDMAFRDQKTADARFESIINDLKSNPHVRAISTNQVIPTAYWQNYNNYFDPVTNKEVKLKQGPADAGFVPVYGIEMAQGKNFDDVLSASTQKNGVLINEKAMNAFGWTNAVGKTIKSKGASESFTVIGVMKDFHYADLQSEIEPLVQYYSGKPSLGKGTLGVKTDAGFTKQVMDKLESALKAMPARRNFSYEMMSDKVDNQYELFDGILRMTNYIAMLTIIIASMGMFGLISLFAKQRVKEIGIRKVLGASVTSIVKMLSKDFLLLVGIAIFIAIPIALYVMKEWLQDFAYHIPVSWWMLAGGGVIAVIIAMLTVSFQAIKSARTNPVESLRSE